MKKINLRLRKFIIVEVCVFVMLIASFSFWLQPFLEVKSIVGIEGFKLTGFEIAFGKVVKVTQMTYPLSYLDIVFKPSPLAQLALYLTIAAIALQITIVVLNIIKKGPKNLWHILNFISCVAAIIAGILCICSKIAFSANNTNSYDILTDTGSITTGIFILSTSIIMFLNSVELFQKEQ